jgi:hypothetical protein
MGADLYIEPIYSENREQWEPLFNQAVDRRDRLAKDSPQWKSAQAEVERYFGRMHSRGYFRDPYNCWDVLAKFDLDWWSDVIPMLDSQGRLSVQRMIQFRIVLWAREWLFEANLAGLPKKQQRYFRRRYRVLRLFLKEAIDRNLPIECSL